MPLFYSRVSALDSVAHKDLHLDRSKGFTYAAKTNAIPLSLAEFTTAAAHYPIVFTRGPDVAALVVTGFRDGENLVVGKDNQWRAGAYVPAYVRAYPFIFIEQPNSDQLVFGIESDSEMLGTSGAALFDDGKPSDALQEAMQFCGTYHQSHKATRDMCQAFDAAGLLAENQAVITFKSGTSARVDGFRVIDPAKLDAISDETFVEWRKKGWIAPIYAHLVSAGRWSQIVDLGAEHLA